MRQIDAHPVYLGDEITRTAHKRGADVDDRIAEAIASKAIVEHGGTITHHHAVGRDHAPYMQVEVGDLGLELLRAVKQRIDPPES
jgi:alkyldihydroxyacetonephosphate synthase